MFTFQSRFIQYNHYMLQNKTCKYLKTKLLPKCNLGFFFFFECTRVKPLYKSIITMKETLIYHIFSDTHSITRVSTHEHEH